MENKLSIGDRLIIENTDYNPLTDFYLEGTTENEYNVRFGYGIISGFASYNKSKVKKHPIQTSQFTFSVEIAGNECNSENPKINEFSKYLTAMNNPALIYRTGLICLREILTSFTDKESKLNCVEDLRDIINSDEPMDSLNLWLFSTMESVPEYFNCKSIIEYSGENAPAIAIYNSERKNNNVVSAIFLVLYTIIMFQVNVLSKEIIIKELANPKFN